MNAMKGGIHVVFLLDLFLTEQQIERAIESKIKISYMMNLII